MHSREPGEEEEVKLLLEIVEVLVVGGGLKLPIQVGFMKVTGMNTTPVDIAYYHDVSSPVGWSGEHLLDAFYYYFFTAEVGILCLRGMPIGQELFQING